MKPTDTTDSSPPPADEPELLGAAARLVADELHVSADETRDSFAQVRLAIQQAERDGVTAGFPSLNPGVPRIGRVSSPVSTSRRWIPVWSTAFVVAAVLTLVVLGQRRTAAPAEPRGASSTSATTYTTRDGERADITLPDGSTATLNVGSRLRVPTDFATGNRTVTLTGAAVFTVNHHAGTPFTVVAGNTSTRVLGTTFLVRHYSTDSAVTVAVRDGKVAVRSAVLTANQQATVTTSGAVRVRPAGAAPFTFATGILTLDDVSLRDAVVELNRWYDIDIRLTDPRLAGRALHATFVAGSSDLAEVLSLALDVRAVQDGRVITLSPK